MTAPETPFPGTDLVDTAFAAGFVAGLGPAMARLQTARGRTAVRTLAASVRPYRWAESRAAVGALRQQGGGALAAAPVLAAWVVLSAGAAQEAGDQHAVHEALLALTDLHPRALAAGSDAPGDDVRRIEQFFAEAVEPHLLALFALPAALWHRGLVSYFARHPTAPDLLAGALESLIGRPGPAPAGYERWFEYQRAEALTLLGRISPQIELARLERLWQAPEATRTGVAGPRADVGTELADPAAPDGVTTNDSDTTNENELLEALLVLAADPEPSVRIEALLALAGRRGRHPSLHAVALRSARSLDPQERRAAARLLAALGEGG